MAHDRTTNGSGSNKTFPGGSTSGGSTMPAADDGSPSSATQPPTRSMASLDFEGRSVAVEAGDTIASALYRAGVRVFSRSFKYHRPRGLYCLSGDCANCLVSVDGEPCTRACMTPAASGQKIHRENAFPSADFDLLSTIWYLRWLLP